MSILLTHESGWIVSHLQLLNNQYSIVNNYDTICNLKFNENIFNINSSYLRANQICKIATEVTKTTDTKKSRKRKRIDSSSINTEQVRFVQHVWKQLIHIAIEQGIFNDQNIIDYNQQARHASQEFYNDILDTPEEFYGGNQSNVAVISKIGSNDYVIPENCRFYSYDVREMHLRSELNNHFDLILMDPPWWNKFIRRNKKGSYKMMYNEELCKIPINNLLNTNGIVAIWCTNSSMHLNAILDIMFPKWGVKLIAKWYWVKVTQSGDVICNFNYGTGKQPYELLIFGALSTNQTSTIPDQKLLISVPSAIHSHKPPIAEVIKPYLVEKPKCLEIFARYLLPDWTSWGLEVLKFQRLSLYNICRVNKKSIETEI